MLMKQRVRSRHSMPLQMQRIIMQGAPLVLMSLWPGWWDMLCAFDCLWEGVCVFGARLEWFER